MHHYFWDNCPELAARWKKAMLGLPPSVLRELAGLLQKLEDFTDQTNLALRGAHDARVEIADMPRNSLIRHSLRWSILAKSPRP